MNVLAVGAHHDDVEIGCGGTLARLVRAGHQAFAVTLTNSETHDDLRGIHRTRAQALTEARRAAAVLGVELLELDGASRDNGTLVYDVTLMRRLEELLVARDVSVVFAHWRSDLNTDHEAASKITVVAARHVRSVLMYRSNWYQPGPPFNGIVSVDISEMIDVKQRSLACYETEIANRSPAWIASFIDRDRSAGFAMGKQYAETFEPVKLDPFGWGAPPR
jgi:LmbE family N-acetylglucosaminyl deacetylase